MNLNSKNSLVSRIQKGRQARRQFVESHLARTLAHQIRATRDKLGWSQEKLATESGMNQNAISRLESPDYGKPTLTTLKRLAGAMDVALIVRLIPFSELIDWVSGTRRVDFGLSTQSLAVPSFAAEEEAGIFDTVAPVPPQRATVCNPLPRVSEERSGSNGIFGSSPQSIESPQKIYLMPSDRARNRDRQQAGPQSDNFSAAVGQL